jgi:hypothetical protein
MVPSIPRISRVSSCPRIASLLRAPWFPRIAVIDSFNVSERKK